MRRSTSGLKHLGMALIICGLILSVTGMGAFSTTTSERQMSVAVAEKSAFLEVEAADPTVSQTGVDRSIGQLPVPGQDGALGGVDNRTSVVLGTVTNRFASSFTSIDVTVIEDGSEAVTVRNPTVTDDSIAPGHSSQLTAAVECDTMGKTTETVTLSIEATGSSTSISTTQSVEITCGVPSATERVNATQPLQP